MAATSWVTYADKAAYTIHFTTYQYIPKNGILTLEMPEAVNGDRPEITGNPTTGFATTASALSYKEHQQGFLKLRANSQVPAGSYELTWGVIKNPRSTAPTNIFKIAVTDSAGNEVVAGAIDNIQMKTAGSFTALSITPKSLVVGAVTDYEVKLTAAIPIYDKD
jgi:hypothetical protein